MRVKNTSARMHRDTVAWLALHLEGGHQVNRAALWHLLLLLDLLALLLLLWLWLLILVLLLHRLLDPDSGTLMISDVSPAEVALALPAVPRTIRVHP